MCAMLFLKERVFKELRGVKADLLIGLLWHFTLTPEIPLTPEIRMHTNLSKQ